jgi:hypothetical protein
MSMDPHAAALEPDADDASSYAIDDGGIDEDAVAMPGNGQASIDDLEAAGQMTPDLLAKARPETAAYVSGPGAEAEQETLMRLLRMAEDSPEAAALLEQVRRMAGG